MESGSKKKGDSRGERLHKRPLEVLEFIVQSEEHGTLVEKSFAINVIRVKEIIKRPKVTHIIDADPAVLGVFHLREDLVPMVDLPGWLGLTSPQQGEVVIVTDLNEHFNGFVVHSIKKIHHLSWDDVRIPDKIDRNETEFIAGIISMEGRLIMMLDFETIFAELTRSEIKIDISRFEPMYFADREDYTVLVVDDSAFSRNYAQRVFETIGYQVVTAANGVEALDILRSADNPISFVFTDLEMPQMDGGELLERVRLDRDIQEIPGLIATSLTNLVSQESQKDEEERSGKPPIFAKKDMFGIIEAVDKSLGVDPNELPSQWDSYGKET
ncbi:chemotaxis protein CheV [Desulfurispira natronophila]|uniref:Two-component system chemotaxis response regulator CheV n=1 Tax=Desulfurispira natronophila TaxID=682562 RepID=A0A7W7Y5F0_9BACT|nr:chemotaxis protein [Desulfurispira natronophila]MBB5022435.1 two-component system chemotaxis response regulator CheV [Desulfurispira natronophila]